jgi:hypothetical protein
MKQAAIFGLATGLTILAGLTIMGLRLFDDYDFGLDG